MIVLLLLVAIAVVSLVGLVRELLEDRPAEVPRSRFVDPDFLPPARRRV